MLKLFSSIINSPSLKIFRWVNLILVNFEIEINLNSQLKIINCEYSSQNISNKAFINPYLGDLVWNLYNDIY